MKTILISLKVFLLFTVVTGFLYPLLVTGIAQCVFPAQANGSLIVSNHQVIGSELIGQSFISDKYFSSRPSAVSYNPLPSGGSNQGLTSIKLKQMVAERSVKFLAINQLDSLSEIPSEMLFASGSGLDPHISPRAALLQVERIAQARRFNALQTQKLRQCIKAHTEAPQFLCLGSERVNVLLLNLDADKIQ